MNNALENLISSICKSRKGNIVSICKSRKGNIVSIKDTYLPQLSIEHVDEAAAELAQLRKILDERDERIYHLEETLQDIINWTQAYPLEVFPEPDFKRVRELLEAGGITLDNVSASNMRHVLKGIEKIVVDTLEKTGGKDG